MKRSWAGALFTSCLMHVCLAGTAVWLLSRAFTQETHVVEVVAGSSDLERGIDLPQVESLTRGHSLHSDAARVERPAEPPLLQGGKRRARPDLPHAGRGGSARANLDALNLSDRVSSIALSRETTTLAQQSQVQRLTTARLRASLDDRRATPNPMQLSFVASGPGNLLERRPPARVNPANGGALGGEASREGGAPGNVASAGEAQDRDEPRVGGDPGSQARYAAGVSHGTGTPNVRARVLTARPPVKRARAAVPASAHGRPNDTVDSSHQVADAVRSLVHAGGLGPPDGQGPGGQQAPTLLPGRDGQTGDGAHADPSGESEGPGLSLAADTGFGRYTARLLEQIDWERAFPSWAVARGIGGLTVVGLTIDRQGRVVSVGVVRPSGVDEFDRNLVIAIRRDGPYGALPATLGSSLTVRIAFDATNPAVGRDGPGPGGRGQ